MRRSAAILLLTLVLGALAAANAGDGKHKNDYSYETEPRMKQCSLKKPWRYNTYDCPTCNSNAGCIKTKCNAQLDGKADVTIDLKCLFGEKVGFVAVSYKDGYNEVCVNNQEGKYYATEIVLSDLKCKELPKLRFIVQNKWWFNPDGKDLMISDSCYDKCTKGKPCHTCVFEDIEIPECDSNYCKPLCPYKNYECPYKLDDCFKFVQYYDYVKVTLKRSCRKKNSHVAFSYTNKSGYKDCADHTCYGDDDSFSFNAACKSSFNWFLEDKYFLNKKAPYRPIPSDDKCYGKFDNKNVCDQCGPFGPVYVPECKPKPYEKPEKPYEKPEKQPYEQPKEYGNKGKKHD